MALATLMVEQRNTTNWIANIPGSSTDLVGFAFKDDVVIRLLPKTQNKNAQLGIVIYEFDEKGSPITFDVPFEIDMETKDIKLNVKRSYKSLKEAKIDPKLPKNGTIQDKGQKWALHKIIIHSSNIFQQ